jgi:hypothetical protein
MQWIEALINVSALVGFVGVATHWPKNHQERGAASASPQDSSSDR